MLFPTTKVTVIKNLISFFLNLHHRLSKNDFNEFLKLVFKDLSCDPVQDGKRLKSIFVYHYKHDSILKVIHFKCTVKFYFFVASSIANILLTEGNIYSDFKQ